MGANDGECAMIDRRVYIVDDDEPLRRAIRRMLTDAGIYTEEFASAEALLEGYEERPIGCVLLDLKLPGMDGLDLLHRIMSLSPANPVVMISGRGDIPTAVRAVKAGALDFLEKPFRREELLEVIGHACRKIEVLPARDHDEFGSLSRREREVLLAFADGASNKTVAARLGLSPRTVEMHRARVLRKLAVENLTQALFRARDAGLLR